MSEDFIHLHVHSEYSLLDGAIKLPRLISELKKRHQPSIALTDHGNLFGGIEFYDICLKEGIKPILGAELYLAPQTIKRREKSEKPWHITILAEDIEGYQNLCRLISISYLEGFYYKPRIDINHLAEYSKGLLCLSGCKQSPWAYFILRDKLEEALNLASSFKDIFKDRFYLELNYHFLEEERKIIENQEKISKKLDIPLVATNDVHYLSKEEAILHDLLLCIQTNKRMDEEDRLRFPNQEFYLKSPEEMGELFPPSILRNTIAIMERCNLRLNLGNSYLPVYFEKKLGERKETNSEELLTKLCKEGIKRRYSEINSSILDRLNYELKIIKEAKLADYFLIIWDVVRFANNKGIPVGPGRGSVAGSLVAYLLGITQIDPIKYNLLFERFLNPGRASLPDVDIDFCYFRRDEILDYVIQRYGKDYCAQIITFGTMLKRAALRDTGRALGINKRKIEFILKNLEERRSQDTSWERLLQSVQGDSELERLIYFSSRLEGHVKHVSTHAAGVVISPLPLTSILPLYRDPKSGTIMTQYDKESIEKIGLLKMDFLGLRTLTVISDTLRFIKNEEKDFVPENIKLDDKKSYELLAKGATVGLFQLESQGMRDLLVRLKPNKFEDLIAAIALYRPGPLTSGMVEEFLKNKDGDVRLLHPLLKEILKETYGTIVYQEQVMRIAQELAGFSLGEADDLRRAMSKKDTKLMSTYKERFQEGCKKRHNISPHLADSIFELLSKFASYGFNKSHAAAYALIALWTTYLKAHYPTFYMAALLSSEIGNPDKLADYIKECKNMNITILPPSINSSYDYFFPRDKNYIEFGLTAIKDVSSNLITAIIEERKNGKFNSIYEFLARIPSKYLNKKSLESLIKSGSLDVLCPRRKALLLSLDKLSTISGKRDGFQQQFLFEDNFNLSLPQVEEDKRAYILGEYEVLGVGLTELFPQPHERVKKTTPKELHLHIPDKFTPQQITKLKEEYLKDYFLPHSDINLYLHIEDKVILAAPKYNLNPEKIEELRELLNSILGEENIRLCPQ
jgi:DNA polymerase-3 subunit alpha